MLGGGRYANKFYGVEKCWGGGIPEYFRDLKKNIGAGGGDYAQILYRLEKCWGGGVCPNIL